MRSEAAGQREPEGSNRDLTGRFTQFIRRFERALDKIFTTPGLLRSENFTKRAPSEARRLNGGGWGLEDGQQGHLSAAARSAD
jgi:hypothetical protein